MVTLEELRAKLEALKDPNNKKTLKETGGLKHVGIDEDEDKVVLVIALEETKNPQEKTFRIQLAKLIKVELGFKGLKLDIEPLNPKEKGTILENDKKVRYIAIASGKGGVGKSTITANLAVTLSRLGHKVGLIDADIYGPSIPSVLDIPVEYPKANEDKKVIPAEKHNVQVISTAFFIENNKPLMWRGPMLRKMLEHFFMDVAWDEEVEYMLIDLPPGTGDVALDIQSFIPQCEVVVVTTPHPTASHIAVKAGLGAKQLKHDIIGVIENMAYFKNPVNDAEEYIFGKGGGESVAKELDVPLLGELQIAQPENGHSIYSMNEENGLEFLGIAKKLINNDQE
ncbi:ornithine carbamoyltransferase protein [Haloplasma contractile SSD-17B]|uniref:Iron-sulfur cluster carrier protein n=2 Tax=Haloplasma TaxID=471824 RepID=U2FRH7_9MOLU|nr:ornithine carbamoyltransferase protein [Haloplasma contractile SSD-17B]